jgi:hypothetical protein
MTNQPEQLLENELVIQLQLPGYQHVYIAYERDLFVNY